MGFLNISQVAIVINLIQFSPPNTLALSPVIVPVQSAQTLTVAERSVVFEETAIEERQVILEVIGPDGKVTDRVQMEEDVLDDLPGLFRKLPDGHYKILLKEPGERSPRLLLDVTLRGGRPENPAEDAAPVPGAAEQGVRNEEDAPATGGLTPLPGARPIDVIAAACEMVVPPVHGNNFTAAPLVVVPVVQRARLAAVAEQTSAAENVEESAADRPATVLGGALTAAALATCAGRGWEDRVDEALASAGSHTLSKAARLFRRWQRPTVRGTRVSRWPAT